MIHPQQQSFPQAYRWSTSTVDSPLDHGLTSPRQSLWNIPQITPLPTTMCKSLIPNACHYTLDLLYEVIRVERVIHGDHTVWGWIHTIKPDPPPPFAPGHPLEVKLSSPDYTGKFHKTLFVSTRLSKCPYNASGMNTEAYERTGNTRQLTMEEDIHLQHVISSDSITHDQATMILMVIGLPMDIARQRALISRGAINGRGT